MLFVKKNTKLYKKVSNCWSKIHPNESAYCYKTYATPLDSWDLFR